MNFTIHNDRAPEYALCENDEQKSILQNVFLLINTRRGTLPMYRDFGLPMEFIGKPTSVAATIATKEILEALELFESRASLASVESAYDSAGRLILVLEVEL